MATPSAAVINGGDLGTYGTAGRAPWMDIDWRDHLRWATIDGDAISYVEIGEGPPLVFVHGLSGSWRNWLENLVPFSATHRVIAMDLPGFGGSPLPASTISMQRYAVLLDGLLGELGIDRAALVGNSMGGLIAIETVLRYPERADRLVLVSPAGISTAGVHLQQTFERLKRVDAGLAKFGAATARHAPRLVGRPRLRRAMMAGVAASPHLLTPAITEEQLRGAGKPGFMPALEAVLADPVGDRIDQISCPTLLIWGTKDRVISVRDAAEYERLIPDVRAVRYEATGHVAMLERPDRFNADLAAFLSA